MPVLTQPPVRRRGFGTLTAHASGPSPYRVVVLGAVREGDAEVLGAALAQDLSDRTGHGVDVEALPRLRLPDADALLPARDLSRVDAVVVVLDPADADDDAVLRDSLRALLHDLARRMTVAAVVALVVPPARTGARGTDAVARAAVDAADALTPVVRLDDVASGPEPDAAAAARIAEAVATALIDPLVDLLPDDRHDEDLRLDAVDRLPARDARWVARFQRIVDDARTAYGTSAAALTIVDADSTRYGVTSGIPSTKVLRRGQSICNRVLRTDGGLIVGDAQLDPRFDRNPEVRAGDVRFYAGYRVESSDGAPLGSLCVFDPAPRTGVGTHHLVALRDLALEAQSRIRELEPPAA